MPRLPRRGFTLVELLVVCEIEMPLPPEIISSADLSVKVADQPSDQIALRGGNLVWHGTLPDKPTSLEVTYTAVGKGLYKLSIAPDRGRLIMFRWAGRLRAAVGEWQTLGR
jgi:hypothetical protein